MAEDKPSARAPGAVVTWLTWWVLLMSLWVAVDDSVAPDELLAGAGAAALAALAAAAVSRQARMRFRIRAAWLPRALALPGQVVSDTDRRLRRARQDRRRQGTAAARRLS